MIDRTAKLSISRQAQLLNISRGTVYYLPKGRSESDQELMKRIDRLHTDHPFAGGRMLRDMLCLQGLRTGRKRVATLMRHMHIEAMYRKPRTTRYAQGHRIYPYLLRNLAITRANQAWSTDITYIPMARGFVYLVAVIDWYTRKVLSWRIAITLDTQFCIDAVEDAIRQYGCPEIFNTDQGSQFTSDAFTGMLQKHGIQISMDGKGAWRDNVFVERLWRSVKYEEVYLKAYQTVREAKQQISQYLVFYNSKRPHSSLGGRTPDQVYFTALPPDLQRAA